MGGEDNHRSGRHLIVGIGEVLWDVYPDRMILGGAPANFICFCNELGLESYIVSSVGLDQPGAEILKKMSERGFSTEFVISTKYHPTGAAKVEIDKWGVPDFRIIDDVAWDFLVAESVHYDLISRADAICYGTLASRSPVSKRNILSLIESAKRDCLKILDLNLRQDFYTSDLIEELLQKSDVLKLNYPELDVLTDIADLKGTIRDKLASLADNFELGTVALTLGSKGSIILSEGRFSSQSGFKVKAVDTVGAGDAFTAVLAAGLVNGLDIELINSSANILASFVCSRKGATPEIPESVLDSVFG